MFLWCSTLLGGIVALVWVVRFIALGPILARREVLDVHSSTPLPTPPPSVSVIVAARNEEHHIAACVADLLAQDYPHLQLIVVDDRSTDDTPAVLGKLAEGGDARLRVLTVERLPEGWFGKPHAMHLGVAHATGEWLLFTDADCRFDSPRAVSIAVAAAVKAQADFLTMIPMLDAPTWCERMIQPVCALALMFWFQPTQVNDDRSSRAYANGAFMLIRRETHRAIGGHEAVRGAMNEDIQLARLTKRGGWRLRVVENQGLCRTRMYPSFVAAWRGWSRIFTGSLGTSRRTLTAAALVLVFSMGPWIGLLGAAAIHLAGGSDGVLAPHRLDVANLAVWGCSVLLMQWTIGRAYAVTGFGRWWSLGYFPAASIVLGILFNATLKTAGATTTVWRGTAYRAGAGRIAHEPLSPVGEKAG
ncbi:MAG: glycosyltransferase family A protein [Planctomycetota bacterium]|mgnify:CR=1 FL=1